MFQCTSMTTPFPDQVKQKCIAKKTPNVPINIYDLAIYLQSTETKKYCKLHQKCIHNTSVFAMLKILIRIIACSALLFGLWISYLLETVTKTKGGSSCLDGGSLVKLLPSP